MTEHDPGTGVPDDSEEPANQEGTPTAPSPPSRPRVPEPDPADRETGKRFVVGHGRTPPLVVTLSDGEIAKDYAPAALIGRIAERIAALLKAMSGGFTPMLYGVQSSASMRLHFGDPDPDAPQGQLPVEITLPQAQRFAGIIELEGDDLFAQALLIGEPMTYYTELVQTVQNEGVTLAWIVRDDTPRVLDPELARKQYARLSAAPETQDRPLTVNGVLYRVITESKGGLPGQRRASLAQLVGATARGNQGQAAAGDRALRD